MLYKTKKKKLLYFENFLKAEYISSGTILLMTEQILCENKHIRCKFYFNNKHYTFEYINQKDFDEVFECISCV